jgi:putative ABC transport system permease protein
VTTTLERSPAATVPPTGPRRSRVRTFLGQWRVALRLARREAWRSKVRSLLVLALVAIPVAAVAGVDIYVRTEAAATTPQSLASANLGTAADAVLTTTGSGEPVQQGWAGSTYVTRDPEKAGSTVSAPTASQLLDLLPAGTRLVDLGTVPQVVLEHDGWGIVEQLRVQDVADPLVAGLWQLREGRLPADEAELALGAAQARRLHAGVGDLVLVTPSSPSDGPATQLEVVGIVDHSTGWGLAGVTAPGTYDATAEGEFLAEVPGGLDWAGVRGLNEVGVVAVSRAVLESPPGFCRMDALCLDSGEAPGTYSGGRVVPAEEAAQAAAFAAVVTVIVVLQVALLAGPAFAVSLRRRQRELGLVGASGGDAATLRRTVLASGVVLGTVGAVVGVVLAWLAVALLGGALPFRPLAEVTGISLGTPAVPPELLALVLVGVLAATAGALVPALAAGRGDVVDSLRGRRALPPVRRGAPNLGYGVTRADGVVLGIGIIVGELGVVVLMPALVSWFARTSGWLPLSGRLAVRDAGRHRMRTTAAACAIAATAAVAVGASAAAQTAALEQSARGRPFLPSTQTLLVSSDPTTTDAAAHDARVAELATLAAATLSGSSVAVLDDLQLRDAPYGGDIGCVAPEQPAPGRDPAFEACEMASVYYGSQLQLVADPADLDQLLGPLAPVDEARAALEAGHVVVLARNALDADGLVTLSLDRWDLDGALDSIRTVTVPGVSAGEGIAPASFLVGTAALEPGGFLHGTAQATGLTSTVAVLPAEPDVADRPTAQDRLLIALSKAGFTDVGVIPADETRDALDETVVLGLGAAATALLAVLVGLMVTALALVDGRADLVTLASVGAAPGVRRRMAAASAGFVSGLGCLVGAVSGVLGVVVLMPLVTSGPSLLVLPWVTVAVVVVAVPLLTMATAWLTTRPTLPLARRTAG